MLKTGYDWCLDANIRVLDLKEFEEDWYYSKRVDKNFFIEWLKTKEVKSNSTPRKTDKHLEYRMYGLVPYNISSIQSGIQYGHAVVEYGQNVRGAGKSEELYNKWATKDKTFIILNGGTTNEDESSKWYGTLQQHRDKLRENKILFSEFIEPDLNNTLTSVVFLVDERVFDKELYPDYVNIPYPWKDKGRGYKVKDSEKDKWSEENKKNYQQWVVKIGGEKNAFLRDFLKVFRLAN
jgi:hypothetical protein